MGCLLPGVCRPRSTNQAACHWKWRKAAASTQEELGKGNHSMLALVSLCIAKVGTARHPPASKAIHPFNVQEREPSDSLHRDTQKPLMLKGQLPLSRKETEKKGSFKKSQTNPQICFRCLSILFSITNFPEYPHSCILQTSTNRKKSFQR